jgi:hypothetical protein
MRATFQVCQCRKGVSQGRVLRSNGSPDDVLLHAEAKVEVEADAAPRKPIRGTIPRPSKHHASRHSCAETPTQPSST